MKYFCILLKSDKKRLNHVISHVLKEIPSLRIIPAIEGKTNQLEYYLQDRKINEKFLKFCKRGQLACLLSHLELWKTMVEEDIEEAIIFEDDVKLPNNFNVDIPKDADFVYLYIHPKSKKEDNKQMIRGYKTYGTVAYYIKKELASEFITFFEKITTTVDDSISWYLDYYKKNYYCIDLVDTVGSLYHHKNGGIGSSIGETILYKNSNGIPSFYIDQEDFLFYPCCDCEDNIYYSNNINKEEILKNDKIAGFSLEKNSDFSLEKNSDFSLENNSNLSLENNSGWLKKSNKIYVNKNTNLYIKKIKGKPSILLPGSCGYIGSHTALEIIEEYPDHDLIIIDDLSNSNDDVIDKLKLFTNNLVYYNLDVKNNIDKVFEYHNIETVIHFAAYKAVGESIENPLKYYSNNIGGLINLLQTMKKYNVKNLIFSSSATVYGEPESLPLTEKSKTSTLNPYGRTKLFAEEILKDMRDMKIICLRYFNPVGASRSGIIGENPKGVPNNLFPYIMNVISGKKEKLYIFGNDYDTEDGTAIRDYLHVSDLAKGHIAAMKYIDKVDFEIFNLGTGKGYSVLEIVNNFTKILNKDIPYEFVERRKGDSPEVYADCSKALKLLGWKAELTLEDMIKDSLNFLNK